MKIWECSVDLAEYLIENAARIPMQDIEAIEVWMRTYTSPQLAIDYAFSSLVVVTAFPGLLLLNMVFQEGLFASLEN